MDQAQEHNMLPRDALRCLWMDAGVVDFKLCDRFFQCDECPFEARLRSQATEPGEKNGRSVRQTSNGSENFKEYFEKQVDSLLDPFNNLDLPQDRMYSSNHTWFQWSREEFIVGIDHCATRLLGPISTIVLPEPPMKTLASSPCAWVVQQDGAIALQTALAGTITAINEKAKENPSLVTNAPYTLGWIFKMRPENCSVDCLLSAENAQAFFHRQSAALRHDIIHHFAELSANVGSTLPDGGRHLQSVQDMLGRRTYFSIIAPLFASRPS